MEFEKIFRAWDGKKMFYPCDVRFDTSIVFNEWGWEVFSHFTGVPETLVASWENKEAKLMEYIGLKDSEGNKIFDSDILGFECPDYDHVNDGKPTMDYYIVKFGKTPDARYGYFLTTILEEPPTHHSYGGCHTSYNNLCKGKIMGNIYENRNLIK